MKQKTAEAVDFTVSLAGLATHAGGVPSGILDSTSLLAGKLSDVVTDWLARPKADFDLKKFSNDLAYLSDSFRERALAGLTVPGLPEISLNDKTSRIKHEPANEHRGVVFGEAFRQFISDYKTHHLQDNLRQAIE